MIIPLNKLKLKKLSQIERLMSISFLMADDNTRYAVSLQLENLILTYGYQAVRDGLNAVTIDIKKEA